MDITHLHKLLVGVKHSMYAIESTTNDPPRLNGRESEREKIK